MRMSGGSNESECASEKWIEREMDEEKNIFSPADQAEMIDFVKKVSLGFVPKEQAKSYADMLAHVLKQNGIRPLPYNFD